MNKRYLLVFIALCLAICSCEIRPHQEPLIVGGNPAGLHFVNFEQGEDETVTFYTNNPRAQGPNGYTYWCIEAQSYDPMKVLEVRLDKMSGSQKGAFGILFSAPDINNFLTVFINKDQQFKIEKKARNLSEPIVIRDWETSEYLFSGFTSNVVRIERNGTGEYRVFFNNAPSDRYIQFEDHGVNGTPVFSGGCYGYLAEVHSAEDFPDYPVKVVFQQLQAR